MKTVLPKKRTLAGKLWLGFGLLIFLLVVISSITYWQIQRVESNITNVIEVQEPLEQTVLKMRIASVEGMQALSDYARDKDVKYDHNYIEAKNRFEELISEFNTLAPNDDIAQLGQEIDSRYKAWEQLGDDLEAFIHDDDTASTNTTITQFENSSEELSTYLEEDILTSINTITSRAAGNASSAASAADKWVLVLGIAGLVAGIAIAWIISRRIAQPITELIKGANLVGSGKIEHRFDIEPKNELGDLGMALNLMLTKLSRSKEALGESEETAWALLDSTTDSVILIDLRGTILASNEIAAERFDKSLEQLIDVSIYDLLIPDVALSLKARIGEVIRTKKPILYQDEREGRILDTTLYPVFNAKGQITRLALFARDVTVRKWVEEVTDKLVRRNELILEAAGEGIYGLDTQGKTTFVNPAAARMLGYKPEDLVGQRHHELIHHTLPNGKPYPYDKCPIYATLKDGIVHTGVHNEVFWRRDGTHFPVEYTSTPIREGREIVGAVVTFRDITDRKRLEDALRSSEEKYRSMFEDAASLVVSINKDMHIIECNARINQILEYTSDEVVGQNLATFIHPDYHTKAQESLDRVLIKGFEYNKQYKMIRKDKTVIDVYMNAAAVRDATGEYIRTICMIDEISKHPQT